MKKEMKAILGAILVLIIILFVVVFIGATPVGVGSTENEFNITANETGKIISSGNLINISGGYIATINLTTSVQDPHWKAFVGWVNGAFTLDDSSGSTIYDWSLTTTEGEVYATRDSGSIEWSNIGCANSSEIEAENIALNHSNPDDNITATFADNTHDTFYVGSINIPANSCFTLNTYVDNVTNSYDTFEEMVLSDLTSIVYATIIEDQSEGFDGNTYDFQMLVPDNGGEGFTSSIPYYIYVEIS